MPHVDRDTIPPLLSRRELLASILAGCGAARVAEAQSTVKIWRLGFISVAPMQIEREFFDQLRLLGYVEGRNLAVDRRYSEGQAERFREFAAALAKANPDLIIATTTPAALAVKAVTSRIPVVLPNSIDPVGVGLVASLAHPGGNITGTTQQAPDLIAKRLQLLVQTIPRVSTVAVVWNAANPANTRVWGELQEAARMLRINLQSRGVRDPADFGRVLADMTRDRPDALLLVGDRLTLQHGAEIIEAATQNRIPSMLDRAYPETAAALLSYGADEVELWRRAAELADRILKGARPADLPFEQPTKFKFVVNVKTAMAIGVTIPPAVLARADQILD
ncbi:MAG TPA: ABC transporter substrate-binding protein [Methylomirabilota bacterium]|nr:ABC transporter substrate-binding protein [Methylomirabilota bacterium]